MAQNMDGTLSSTNANDSQDNASQRSRSQSLGNNGGSPGINNGGSPGNNNGGSSGSNNGASSNEFVSVSIVSDIGLTTVELYGKMVGLSPDGVVSLAKNTLGGAKPVRITKISGQKFVNIQDMNIKFAIYVKNLDSSLENRSKVAKKVATNKKELLRGQQMFINRLKEANSDQAKAKLSSEYQSALSTTLYDIEVAKINKLNLILEANGDAPLPMPEKPTISSTEEGSNWKIKFNQ